MAASIAALVVQLGLSLVGIAGTGEEALRLATEHSPHLTLIDIGLPGLNGLETTRRLRARGTSKHVFIVTGHDTKEHRQRAAEVGADTYILKSELFVELPRAVAVFFSDTRKGA